MSQTTQPRPETARNATLRDLAELLKDQHTRKLDVVAAASALRVKNGALILEGTEPVLTADGVSQGDGVYRPTAVADGHLADKLSIPVQYLRRLRESRMDLFDANVNGLLRGRSVRRADGTAEVIHPADDRKFLVRCFRSGDGGPGVARAVLSDSYKMIDNLDALTAAMDGIRQAGVPVEIESADLTDSRMYVRVVAPGIAAYAPSLLAGYRNPFADPALNAARRHGRTDDPETRFGRTATGEPIVFAGFVLTNSETGGGAFTITPRLMVQICRNGMTINKDAARAVHLGGKLDEGTIRWSDDTNTKQLAVITAKARDAVRTFLDPRYMTDVIEDIERKASRPVGKPADAIQAVAKSLAFTQKQTDDILDHFIRGAQPTAGGIVNAITSYAQTVADADTAADIEGRALKALDLISA
ncbi:DUF932 domain-containing protein (plasmid) [Streptomycetaceae bacterium NBC_01309]